MVQQLIGSQEWYRNNQLHRQEGPAVIDKSGLKSWYFNGKCHREDDFAKIKSNGDKIYYFYNRRLNDKKALIDCVNIRDLANEEGKSFFTITDFYGTIVSLNFQGIVHNNEGPAIVRKNKVILYFLCGRFYTKEEWEQELFMKSSKK